MPPSGKPTRKKKAKKKNSSSAFVSSIKAIPKKRGRPKGASSNMAKDATAAMAQQRSSWSRERSKKSFKLLNELDSIDTSKIDWKRRLDVKQDLNLFGKEYFPAVTYLPPADYHQDIISKLQKAFIGSHKSAIGVPRGGGKDTWLNIAMMWGTANAFKVFPFLIGSTDESSIETLSFIKNFWYSSEKLRFDFPELGLPILITGNRWSGAKSQTYNGINTDLVWGSDTVQYPNIILREQEAEPYLLNDPSLLYNIKNCEFVNVQTGDPFREDGYFIKSGGTNIQVSGIEGSFRGKTVTHPIMLELRRPDIVILNDIQKDQRAESPTVVDKLIKRIDGAVEGLSGPDRTISAVMLATVIEEKDVSDQYLSREIKPEWSPERWAMVVEWPEGLSNYDIDPASESGKYWIKYSELRQDSLRMYDDIRLATEYYRENQEEMDKGFVVSWKARYDKERGEISAIQGAMEKRFKSPLTFPSEYQNAPRRADHLAFAPIVRSRQLAEKVTQLPKGYAPQDANYAVASIDVQDEYLQYMIYTCNQYYGGAISEWGTFPEEPMRKRYWRKNQAAGWAYLSKRYAMDHPENYKDIEVIPKEKRRYQKLGKYNAPIEAKIYYGLSKLCDYLLGKVLPKFEAVNFEQLLITKICIDSGSHTEVVRRFVRDMANPRILSSQGLAPTPGQRQFEEYERRDSWIFEDQINPVKEVMWYYAPIYAGKGSMMELRMDVNRLKNFAFKRLYEPLGSTGGIYLYNDSPENHQMICDQICESEYPEPRTERGRTKDMWQDRGSFDNEGLDNLVMCLAMASMSGCRLRELETARLSHQPKPKKRKSLREIWEEKRQRKVG